MGCSCAPIKNLQCILSAIWCRDEFQFQMQFFLNFVDGDCTSYCRVVTDYGTVKCSVTDGTECVLSPDKFHVARLMLGVFQVTKMLNQKSKMPEFVIFCNA